MVSGGQVNLFINLYLIRMALADQQKIKELLTRGVENVIELEHLKNRLLSGEKLRIKLGIDPTGPKLHLGRATQLWKLEEFQDLGHQIVLIIGDFTALIGDASDKKAMRRVLTEEEVKKNMISYTKQIGQILDLKKVEIQYNSKWLKKINIRDLINLAMRFTAQQMINRRNFKERWDTNKEIGLHELLYPLCQGYDSVAVKADVEIGGTDQLFNLMAGRKIQEIFDQKPQDLVILKMIEGLDGEKMSTSRGNVINITDVSNEMFGKIMSMRDEMILKYFELCTQVPLAEINQLAEKLKSGANPRDLKAQLAREIVKLYHGEKTAEQAAKEFDKIFRERKAPEEIKTVKINLGGGKKLTDLMFEYQLAPSKGEAARLIDQKAVEINNEVILDRNYRVLFDKPEIKIIKVGKRGFLRLDII